MQTSKAKALEMLEQGLIEELKAILRDEIYAMALNAKPNAKKRYTAMKKYLRYIDGAREILKKPCEFEYEGKMYNAFCSGYSLILTTESCGEIEMCSEPETYPDLTRLIDISGDTVEIDFKRVIAEAKSLGYKFKKSAIYSNDYLMHFNGAYFKIGLIDITYGVLDDGAIPMVHHGGGSRRPISFVNELGLGMIMPVYITDTADCTIIQALK